MPAGDLAPLPLAISDLPESLHRFAAPDAPTPARMMAAKGLVPVKGHDLVVLLLQFGADPDEQVADAAKETLAGIPDNVRRAACEAPLHPSLLDALVEHVQRDAVALQMLAANRALADQTAVAIARTCDEAVAEIIATDQQRVLRCPAVLEALYKNRHTRMSTVDRLVELASRHGVNVDGIPAFAAHAEALQGQLIPEPTDEVLPSDNLFSEALAADDDDPDAVTVDAVEGTEEVSEKFKPLGFRISQMSTHEKIRMALVGNSAARALLVRDKNRQVAFAAITSPQTTDVEAANVARSKEVSEEILRYIGNRREWGRSYELKRALVFNPKTPMSISLRYLGHMRPNDLKTLARSRGVAQSMKSAAQQRIQKAEQQAKKKKK